MNIQKKIIILAVIASAVTILWAEPSQAYNYLGPTSMICQSGHTGAGMDAGGIPFPGDTHAGSMSRVDGCAGPTGTTARVSLPSGQTVSAGRSSAYRLDLARPDPNVGASLSPRVSSFAAVFDPISQSDSAIPCLAVQASGHNSDASKNGSWRRCGVNSLNSINSYSPVYGQANYWIRSTDFSSQMAPFHEYSTLRFYFGLRCNKSSGSCSGSGQQIRMTTMTIYHQPGPAMSPNDDWSESTIGWRPFADAYISSPESEWSYRSGCGFLDFFCEQRWEENTVSLGRSNVYIKCGTGSSECSRASVPLRLRPLWQIYEPMGLWALQVSLAGSPMGSYDLGVSDPAYRAGPDTSSGLCVRYNYIVRDLGPRSSPNTSPCPMAPFYLSAQSSSDFYNWGPSSTGLTSKSLSATYPWNYRPNANAVNTFIDTYLRTWSPVAAQGFSVFNSALSPQLGRVMFDNKGPDINFTGVSGSYLNQTNFDFSFSASDAAGISTIEQRRSEPSSPVAGQCSTNLAWAATVNNSYNNPTSLNYSRGFNNLQDGQCYTFRATVYDRPGAELGSASTNTRYSSSITRTYLVDTTPPEPFDLDLSANGPATHVSGSTIYINAQSGRSGSFTVSADPVDRESGIASVLFPTIPGMTGGGAVNAPPYQQTYTWSGAVSANGAQTIIARNRAGGVRTASFIITPDTDAPELLALGGAEPVGLSAQRVENNLIKLKIASRDLLSGPGSGYFEYCSAGDNCPTLGNSQWVKIDQPSELFSCQPEMPGQSINFSAEAREKRYRCTFNTALVTATSNNLIYLRAVVSDNVANLQTSAAIDVAGSSSCPAVQ